MHPALRYVHYLNGVICNLEICLVVRLSDHIPEAIHKPDLVIRALLLHMFSLEISIRDKCLGIFWAVRKLV